MQFLLIPSLGLSDMIHLGVIIWHKVTNYSNKTSQVQKLVNIKNSFIMTVFGGIMIITVLFITLFGAASIIYISIAEKHSTVYFVKKTTNNALAFIEDKIQIRKNVNQNLQLIAINTIENKTAKCDYGSSTGEIIETDSVVDFLKLNGHDYSLKSRVELAKRLSIDDYVGNPSQNRQIIDLLIKKRENEEKLIISDQDACNLPDNMSILGIYKSKKDIWSALLI